MLSSGWASTARPLLSKPSCRRVSKKEEERTRSRELKERRLLRRRPPPRQPRSPPLRRNLLWVPPCSGRSRSRSKVCFFVAVTAFWGSRERSPSPRAADRLRLAPRPPTRSQPLACVSAVATASRPRVSGGVARPRPSRSEPSGVGTALDDDPADSSSSVTCVYYK